jgi:hypothetical protein
MYPRTFAGVVISDEYEDDQRIVVPDDPFEQVYRAQAYGDDGITDGAEGLGMVQAQRLKAKLGARRRRLRVGRSPYAVVGGSTFNYGFGIAPLAVAGAAKAAGIKISLKKGSPRVFGGPLVSTVNSFRARVERGDLSVIQEFDNARKTSKAKGAWQRIWNEMLPTWLYGPQMYALIKSRDPAFPGAPPIPSGAATGPAVAPPAAAPTLFPTVTPAPAPGPVVDATGFPAPYFPPTPSPISPAAGGGGPTASETTAAAANGGGGVEPMQAGMMGGIDLKNPMVMLTLAGLGLFVVSQFAGKGTSRRSRR